MLKKKIKRIKHGLFYIVAFSSIRDKMVAQRPYYEYANIDYNCIHRAVLWYIAYRFKRKNPMEKALRKAGCRRIKVY